MRLEPSYTLEVCLLNTDVLLPAAFVTLYDSSVVFI